MNDIKTMTVRFYTSKGIFVDTNTFDVFDKGDAATEARYFLDLSLRELSIFESEYNVEGKGHIQKVLPTNISVRDPKTGRFLSWK